MPKVVLDQNQVEMISLLRGGKIRVSGTLVGSGKLTGGDTTQLTVTLNGVRQFQDEATGWVRYKLIFPEIHDTKKQVNKTWDPAPAGNWQFETMATGGGGGTKITVEWEEAPPPPPPPAEEEGGALMATAAAFGGGGDGGPSLLLLGGTALLVTVGALWWQKQRRRRA